MHMYFQAFAQLLQAPQDDAKMIIRERFPVPRLVVCDQHGSQVSIFLGFLFWFLSLITFLILWLLSSPSLSIIFLSSLF